MDKELLKTVSGTPEFDCYAEGKEDAEDGVLFDSCPYDEDTQAAKSWQSGWSNARK